MRKILIATLALGLAGPVCAQDAAPQLSIDVNAMDQSDAGCSVTFVAQNGLSVPITSAVFETVLFDQAGKVVQLTLFDFADLPVARPRVRQFVVAGQSCEQIGQILFNGVETCDGEGVTPAVCEAALTVTSRVDVEVSG